MKWFLSRTIETVSEMNLQMGDVGCIGKAYINTRWESLPGELQLEIKLIDTDIESSFTTQSNLILEQRSMAVAEVLGLPGVTRRGQPEIRHWVVRAIRALEDSHVAMKADR